MRGSKWREGKSAWTICVPIERVRIACRDKDVSDQALGQRLSKSAPSARFDTPFDVRKTPKSAWFSAEVLYRRTRALSFAVALRPRRQAKAQVDRDTGIWRRSGILHFLPGDARTERRLQLSRRASGTWRGKRER